MHQHRASVRPRLITSQPADRAPSSRVEITYGHASTVFSQHAAPSSRSLRLRTLNPHCAWDAISARSVVINTPTVYTPLWYNTARGYIERAASGLGCVLYKCVACATARDNRCSYLSRNSLTNQKSEMRHTYAHTRRYTNPVDHPYTTAEQRSDLSTPYDSARTPLGPRRPQHVTGEASEARAGPHA